MIITFFGDCMVEGTISYYSNNEVVTRKTKQNPCKQISDYFNVKVNNRGLRRSGLSRNGCIRFPNETKPNPNNSLYTRLLNEDLSETNILLIWLPINDFGASCPLDDYEKTFEEIINHVNENYPLIKIGIITGHERFCFKRTYVPGGCLKFKNKTNATLNDYNKIALKICKEKNIPCLEINDFTFINPENDKELLPDMIHPTQDTLNKLMKIIINWFNENFEIS